MTALEVSGLDVTTGSLTAGSRRLVADGDLSVAPGGILVILGETGSGKSLLAQAIMGTLPPGLGWSGRIVIGGTDVGRLGPADRRALWGRRIALLPQEPWQALDPLMRADEQVAEVHALIRAQPWREARGLAGRALTALGLSAAGARRLPFQLSGGMAQRVAIATTDAAGAPLLMADEPTKGLDADRRDEVADLLRARAAAGTAVVVITHDLALARRLGGEVAVMLEARVVERGPTAAVLDDPRSDYTKRLVAADPSRWMPVPARTAGDPVVAGTGLSKRLGGASLFEGLDVAVRPGEIVAISGPSGCGKTTLGNLLLGLMSVDAGRIARAAGTARHRFQKIYQDPVASFAPGVSLRRALDDVIRLHGARWSEAERLLVAFRVPSDLLDRRPDQVSGGELQRVALARALLVDPVFLFADEATSRLDPVTQKDVFDLLRTIVADRGLGVLMVTHDRDLAAGTAGSHLRLLLDHRLA